MRTNIPQKQPSCKKVCGDQDEKYESKEVVAKNSCDDKLMIKNLITQFR